MTFDELVAAVAVSSKMSQAKARQVLHLIADTMRNEIAKPGTVHLVDVGTFRQATYRARIGTHPTTRQPVSIPAQPYIRYTPTQDMRDAIN